MNFTEQQQKLVRDLNRVAYDYLSALWLDGQSDNFNVLADLFNDGHVIVGGDSACFHLQSNGIATDCNHQHNARMPNGNPFMMIAEIKTGHKKNGRDRHRG